MGKEERKEKKRNGFFWLGIICTLPFLALTFYLLGSMVVNKGVFSAVVYFLVILMYTWGMVQIFKKKGEDKHETEKENG